MRRYAWLVLAACIALPAFAWAADVDAALKDVAAYEFGKGRESLTVVSEAVRDSQGSPEARKAIVGKLLDVLKGTATIEGKQFVCRQLSVAGGDESVPALAALLNNKDMSDMARYALERIPGAVADKALLGAIAGTSGTIKIGIINTLGARECAAAVAPLANLAKDSDKAIAGAAFAALGHIGDAAAVKALEAAQCPCPMWADAYLLCADKLAAKSPDEAAKLYEKLMDASQPDSVRVAAFRGSVVAKGAAAVPSVAEALAGDNAALRKVAAKLVRTLVAEDAAATGAFVAVLPKMDPAGQALLISALADRGDKAALAAVTEASKSEDASVRLAAIAALGKLGGAESALPLATVASATKGAEHEAARASLGTLRGADVDGAIVGELAKAQPAVKIELARALTARNAVSAVPALLGLSHDADEPVRVEAYTALGALAAETDLPALVDGLAAEPAQSVRDEAVNAVVAVSKRIADESKRASVVLAKLESAKEDAATCALYAVLGQVGAPDGLKPLVEGAKGKKGEVKDAAMRALSGWPTVAAIDDMTDLVEKAKDETHRVLLTRGLLRLLELPSDRPADATLAYYAKLLKSAEKADEKKTVLGGLANVQNLGALALVEPCLGSDELKQEAALAADKIKASAYKATASANSDNAGRAFDGKMESRWDSAGPQKPDMFFAVDMGAQYLVSKITLDTSPNANDFPRGYKVFVSADANDLGAPVAEGNGSGPVTEIAFTPKAGQFVKIVQTGSDEKAGWSIHELKIDSTSIAKDKK